MVAKRRFFMLISNPLKKFEKKSPKQSYKQNKFYEHEKVLKRAHFHYILVTTFSIWNFFSNISTDPKSAKTSSFFYTQIEFLGKFSFAHIITFLQL
jgi:hypothetical protein